MQRDRPSLRFCPRLPPQWRLPLPLHLLAQVQMLVLLLVLLLLACAPQTCNEP